MTRPASVRAAARGLRAEVHEAVKQVGVLATGAPRALAQAVRPSWRLLVLAVWLLGIAADGLTTVLMMRSGVSEEGNPAAAAGMAVLGTAGYTALVSLVCLCLAALAVTPPQGRYDLVVVVVLIMLGAAKCWQGASNAFLWIDLSRHA